MASMKNSGRKKSRTTAMKARDLRVKATKSRHKEHNPKPSNTDTK
jgi:hypothetical protein